MTDGHATQKGRGVNPAAGLNRGLNPGGEEPGAWCWDAPVGRQDPALPCCQHRASLLLGRERDLGLLLGLSALDTRLDFGGEKALDDFFFNYNFMIVISW